MDDNLMKDLRGFLRDLAEEEGLRTTIFEAVKGSALTGVGALTGAIFLGPVGLFLGGSIFGGLASLTCKDFKPLHQVLSEMPEHRWRSLESRVKRIMQDKGVMDIVGLAALAIAGSPLRDQVVLEMLDFAQNELGKSVVRR